MLPIELRFLIAIVIELPRLAVLRNYANILWRPEERKALRWSMYIGAAVLAVATRTFTDNIWVTISVLLATIVMVSIGYSGQMAQRLVSCVMIWSINVGLNLASSVATADLWVADDYAVNTSFLSLFLFYLSSILARKIFRRQQPERPGSEWWTALLIAVCSAAVIFFLSGDSVASWVTVMIVSAVLFLINFLVYNFLISIDEKCSLQVENLSMRNQMAIYDSQLSDSIRREQAVRTLRHDMKHHVNELNYLADSGDLTAIKEYLTRMGEELHSAEGKVNSGVVAIDGVMSYMVQAAEQKGITVKTHVTVPEEMQLSSYDMNVLLGNLMQNAIEATEKCGGGTINASIRYNRGCILINISNPLEGPMPVIDDSLPSIGSRRSNSSHGYGLRSVRAIVEKYDGSVFYEEEGGRFVARAMLIMDM